jgi:hypothetical protein
VRLPGGWLIPGAAALVCIVLAASAKIENLIAGAIAVAVGLVVYLFRRPPQRRATAGDVGGNSPR